MCVLKLASSLQSIVVKSTSSISDCSARPHWQIWYTRWDRSGRARISVLKYLPHKEKAENAGYLRWQHVWRDLLWSNSCVHFCSQLCGEISWRSKCSRWAAWAGNCPLWHLRNVGRWDASEWDPPLGFEHLQVWVHGDCGSVFAAVAESLSLSPNARIEQPDSCLHTKGCFPFCKGMLMAISGWFPQAETWKLMHIPSRVCPCSRLWSSR